MKNMGNHKKIKSLKYRSLNILLIGLIIISLFPQASFAGRDTQDFNTNTENLNQLEKETPKSIPGELIVTIANSTNSQGRALGEAEPSTSDQFDNIRNKGFELKDGVIKQSQQGFSILSQKGITPFEEKVMAKSGPIYLVEYDQKYTTWQEAKKELANTLKKNGVQVKHIEPNYEVKTLEFNTIHEYQIWNYDMINLEEAWEITEESHPVFMAVLDTGIDHTHESLKDFVATELGKNFSDSGTENDTMDRHGHGSHVAGIIASYHKVSGVTQNAKLIPVKVMNDEGIGTQYGIIKGIYYAVEQGADVINMSIGVETYHSAHEDAINFAAAEGVVVVGASGNAGEEPLHYPAKFPSVIGVGALDQDGVRSSYSNYGEGLNLMAPGSKVYSTTPGNNYHHYSGTSMAAPHVAGVAGLMRSMNPEISLEALRFILEDTAEYTEEMNQLEYGMGLVNAGKALSRVKAEMENMASMDKNYGVRIAGGNRYETAYHIAMFNDPNPETVIIVRGDDVDGVPQVVDGLAASGLAGAKNAQILLVTPNSIPDSTKDAIVELKPQNAIVVGGTATISDDVAKNLKLLGLNVTRVSGSNRYATAAEVALAMGAAKDRTALIVDGHAYVDSLVAGPLSHQGYPILMVNNTRGQVPQETRDAIKDLTIENLILIGGEGVISKDLEEQLNQLEGASVKARYGGTDRISTSLLLGAHENYQDIQEFSIVNGFSYVDAVAASTLGSPVIYFGDQSGITENIEDYLKTKEEFQAIGGTAIISELIYEKLEEIMQK